jgi:diaminopimelate epimerase
MLLEESADYDFKCSFFNPDGSTGMMCGNGGRAIVKYALDRGVINKSDENVRFEMAGSIYNAKFSTDLIDLEMPDIKSENAISIVLSGRETQVYYVDNGSQHTVININEINASNLAELNIDDFGKEVRYNEIFGSVGSNANFYSLIDGVVRLRTYERGVEKETGACGTGAVATAITAVRNDGLSYPVEIVPSSGEKLIVDKRTGANAEVKFHLIGPAIILSEIEVEV